MFLSNLDLTILIILCCFIAIAYIQLHRRFITQKRQFTTLSNELDIALRCLNEAKRDGYDPKCNASLEEAQIKKRLELGSTESTNHARSENGDPPIQEKYRHAATLANHGLDSYEIASILKISPGETEQLIKLVKFANQT